MRTETIDIFTFSELSEEQQANAIEHYRNSYYRHGCDEMQIYYDDLRDQLKTNPNYIAEFSDDYCCKYGLGLVQDISKLKAIYSIQLKELDPYRRQCSIDISFHNETLLDYLIKKDYSEHKAERLIKLVGTKIDFGPYEIGYYGQGSNDNFLISLCKDLDAKFESLIETIKLDIEHFLARQCEETEDYYHSDEYIRETLEAKEYGFARSGEIY